MTIEWISPNAGLLTSELELTFGDPVFRVQLECEVDNSSQPIDSNTLVDSSGQIPPGTPPIFYQVFSGQIVEYSRLIQTGTNIGYLDIIPLVRELDEYVPEYVRPEDFTYDTDDTSGGKYATYGSALSGGYTFNFTIRAWDATGLTTYEDSDGYLQYDIDSNLNSEFADREFSVHVFNNWSSDRDSFILDYFENETIKNDLGNDLTPEDWLIYQKQKGFYI